MNWLFKTYSDNCNSNQKILVVFFCLQKIKNKWKCATRMSRLSVGCCFLVEVSKAQKKIVWNLLAFCLFVFQFVCVFVSIKIRFVTKNKLKKISFQYQARPGVIVQLRMVCLLLATTCCCNYSKSVTWQQAAFWWNYTGELEGFFNKK